MSRRYKVTALTVVGVAVLAILLVSNLAVFDPGEADQTAPADEQFRATEDPYSAFNETLREDKPVVIEFYARW